MGALTAAPRDLSEPANRVLVASSQLFSFSRTIHNELDAPEGEPIASSSDDLLGGIAPVRGLVVEAFHPVNAQLRRVIRIFTRT